MQTVAGQCNAMNTARSASILLLHTAFTLAPFLPQVAVRALQQLLSMGAAGGAQGLAAVCDRLPDPSEEAIEEAGLPSFEGGPGLLCQTAPNC